MNTDSAATAVSDVKAFIISDTGGDTHQTFLDVGHIIGLLDKRAWVPESELHQGSSPLKLWKAYKQQCLLHERLATEVNKFVGCYIIQERGSIEVAAYSEKLVAEMRSLEILLGQTEDKKLSYKRENAAMKAYSIQVQAGHKELMRVCQVWQDGFEDTTREITVLEARFKKQEQRISCLEHELNQKTVEAAAGAQTIDDLTAQLECVLAQKAEDEATSSRKINELLAHSKRVFEETMNLVMVEAQTNMDQNLAQVRHEAHTEMETALTSVRLVLEEVGAGLGTIVKEIDEILPELLCATSGACEDMRALDKKMQTMSGDNKVLAAALAAADPPPPPH